jgi:anti-sigma factor RsiW
MNCHRFVTRLADSLDGQLAEAERHDLDVHKMLCEDCEAFEESSRRTRELCREAFSHVGGSGPSERWIQQLMRARRSAS